MATAPNKWQTTTRETAMANQPWQTFGGEWAADPVATAQGAGYTRLGYNGTNEIWKSPAGEYFEYNPTTRQYRPSTASMVTSTTPPQQQAQTPPPTTQSPASTTTAGWSSLQGSAINPNDPYGSAQAAGYQRVGSLGQNEVWKSPDGQYYEYNPATRQYRTTVAPQTQQPPAQQPQSPAPQQASTNVWTQPTSTAPAPQQMEGAPVAGDKGTSFSSANAPPTDVWTQPTTQPIAAPQQMEGAAPQQTAGAAAGNAVGGLGVKGTSSGDINASAPVTDSWTPPSVLSPAGGIDPNFIANQSGQAALAVGNMPNALGSYLDTVNPNQFASWMNSFIQQANPGAAASNLNNFMQDFNNWDVQGNFVQPGLQGIQGLAARAQPYREQINAWQPQGLDQTLAMGSSTPDAVQRANQMLAQYSSGAPPTLQQSSDLLRQYATFAPQVGSTPEGQAALNQMSGLVQQGISPFLTGNVGDVGSSPTMKAAVDAWRQNVMPIVQQQMQLAGLGRSAATAGAAGESLTSAMVPLIQQEYQNRLQAANLGTGLYGALSGTQQWQGQQNLGARESQIGAANMLGQSGLGLNQQQIGAAQALGQSGLNLNQQQLAALQAATQGGTAAEQLRQAGILGTSGMELGAYQNLLQSGGTAEQLRQAGILGGTGLQYQGANNAANLQSQGMLGAAGMLGNLGQFGISSLQQGLGLEQQAGVNAANIANQERSRQLQAALGAGNLLLGLSNPLGQAGQQVQNQQQMYLQGGQQAGQLQRDITQQGYTSEMMDFLRRQALGESSSYGLFGGSVLPKTLNTAASTSGGK